MPLDLSVVFLKFIVGSKSFLLIHLILIYRIMVQVILQLKIGMITDTCFVIVQGVYQADHVFKVLQLDLPPIESRKQSKYH